MSHRVCLLVALLAWFLQILSLGVENWAIVSNSTIGLWTHCNYSNKEFTCCQPLDRFLAKSHGISNIPAWVIGVRVLEVLGCVIYFVLVVSCIRLIIVKDINLKRGIRISGMVISITAGYIIVIGGLVYRQQWREETWLGGAILSFSFTTSLVTVFMQNVCFGLLSFCPKKRSRVGSMRSFSVLDSEWQNILQNPTTPSYWNQFEAEVPVTTYVMRNPDVKCKTTTASESEFHAVKSLVESTWESSKVGIGADARNIHTRSISVTDVKRVENIDLWHNYVHARTKIIQKILRDGPYEDLEDISIVGPVMTSEHLNSALTRDLYPDLNECYLFHGTKSQFVDNIMTKGIDPRHSGNNTMMGRGIYCAESSTKSDQYTDDKNHRLRVGLKMILVRMLLGNIFVANNARLFKLPPCVTCLHDNCTIQHHEHFDSVVVDIPNKLFREFIVYDAHQCYPEYIITYDRY